jgi:predicted Zn-dependent protease
MSADDIVARAMAAGYNLNGMKELLRKLAPG